MQDSQSAGTDARELFARKWRVTERAVTRHARRLHLRPEDAADISQAAALVLLRTIARATPVINAEWVARAAISAWFSSNKRHFVASLDGWGDKVPAKSAASTYVDNICMTATDAALDHPDLVGLWTSGITMSETARRLGLSRQRIHQIAERLGGVAFALPGQKRRTWRFPKDLGQVSHSAGRVGILDSGDAA